MLKIAALVLASATVALGAAASADTSSTLVSNSAWWERVTVTLDGNGKPEACAYVASLNPSATEDCAVDSDQAAVASHASASKGEITRITFERRFDPGGARPNDTLAAGDTLLGGQVMSLAIDPRGSVKDCHVVAASGDMRPEYSCDDATAERFQASVGGAQKSEARQGYMTILVYGHSEHMV